MLTPGQTLSLAIEKPAAGGRMIARANGHVVLVAGAIPGERVLVRIERVAKGVAYGESVAIEAPSPDRRPAAGDPLCGGCLYGYIAYARQLEIKAQVVADAFLRIGRIPWPSPIHVVASPEDGYRMRARLHVRRGRLGFFREGSNDLCDMKATRQLLASSCDALERLESWLASSGTLTDAEIELSENIDASARVVHVESATTVDPRRFDGLAERAGLTGLTVSEPMRAGGVQATVVTGDPRVSDVLTIGDRAVTLRRHVLGFFQGNRYLLRDIAAHVAEQVTAGEEVIDLYAGAGLFSLAAAARGARVTAVEGDAVSAEDLALNARSLDGAVDAVHQSVEMFTSRLRRPPDSIIVDPPRTGMSKASLAGALALGASRFVYVSCDVATLARDARRFVDAGYALTRLDAFDLFPNTPHVETVAAFQRA